MFWHCSFFTYQRAFAMRQVNWQMANHKNHEEKNQQHHSDIPDRSNMRHILFNSPSTSAREVCLKGIPAICGKFIDTLICPTAEICSEDKILMARVSPRSFYPFQSSNVLFLPLPVLFTHISLPEP